MKTTQYQPKTGMSCICRPGRERDNCPLCEGTGQRIDFAAIRERPIAAPRVVVGSYRTLDGKAQIEWELKPTDQGPEFSASGEYDHSGGQNIEEIAAAYPGDDMVQRIAKVWRVYHLNGMKAGTPEQEAELSRRKAAHPEDIQNAPYNGDHYAWALGVLKSAGLYEVPLTPGLKCTGSFPAEVLEGKRGYRYGERWIHAEIPADIIAEIESWSDVPAPVGSLGEHKTDCFLKNHGLICRITLSDSKPAPWEPSGHHYRVMITGKGRARLVFDFWGSASDASKGKSPSAYDVLSCAASDINTPETFEDFCAEFGDSADSIKAKQTFTRANRFAQRLRAFFTAEEIEALREIA